MQTVDYDVAISFAAEDREKAVQLSRALKIRNLRVFYDEDQRAALFGRDLYSYLSDVYSKQALFTVVLVSRHYAAKAWTNHERRAIQARALREEEYLLPVRLDDAELPGLLETTAYLPWAPLGAEKIADLVADKMMKRQGDPRICARSGVEVFCRRRFVPRSVERLNPRPMCMVDDEYEVALTWHRYSFIPLVPEMRHHLRFFIRAAYIGPRCSIGEIDCLVRGAEVVRYEYVGPLTLFGSASVQPVK